MSRRRRGMTLVELMVMAVIFSLFATTVLSVLTIALRYWTQSNQRVLAEQNLRVAMQAITSELRQGVPDADVAGANPATGYLSLSPAVPPTAVLTPNANTVGANYLAFTEPNPTNYDPSQTTFSAADPSNFQRVRYYVSGGSLRRERVQWSSAGAVTSTVDDALVSASSSGIIALTVQYLSATTFTVAVTTREGNSQYSLSSTVTVLGQ